MENEEKKSEDVYEDMAEEIGRLIAESDEMELASKSVEMTGRPSASDMAVAMEDAANMLLRLEDRREMAEWIAYLLETLEARTGGVEVVEETAGAIRERIDAGGWSAITEQRNNREKDDES